MFEYTLILKLGEGQYITFCGFTPAINVSQDINRWGGFEGNRLAFSSKFHGKKESIYPPIVIFQEDPAPTMLDLYKD